MCMRASVSLGPLETKTDIPGARERSQKMMDTLKYSGKILKNIDAGMNCGKQEKQREVEKEK